MLWMIGSDKFFFQMGISSFVNLGRGGKRLDGSAKIGMEGGVSLLPGLDSLGQKQCWLIKVSLSYCLVNLSHILIELFSRYNYNYIGLRVGVGLWEIWTVSLEYGAASSYQLDWGSSQSSRTLISKPLLRKETSKNEPTMFPSLSNRVWQSQNFLSSLLCFVLGDWDWNL